MKLQTYNNLEGSPLTNKCLVIFHMILPTQIEVDFGGCIPSEHVWFKFLSYDIYKSKVYTCGRAFIDINNNLKPLHEQRNIKIACYFDPRKLSRSQDLTANSLWMTAFRGQKYLVRPFQTLNLVRKDCFPLSYLQVILRNIKLFQCNNCNV